MTHILIAFNTNTSQGKVRHTLMGPEYGYIHVIKTADEDTDLSLPVNALAHPNKSPEQAVADIKAVCQTLGVTLKKHLVFEVAETHS